MPAFSALDKYWLGSLIFWKDKSGGAACGHSFFRGLL